MKKIIVALTTMALCLTMFVSVSLAAATVTASASSYVTSTGVVTISGTATSADVSISITQGTDPTPIAYHLATVVGNNYTWDYTNTTLSGIYTVTVINNDDNTTATDTFDTTVAASSTPSSSTPSSSTPSSSTPTSSTPTSSTPAATTSTIPIPHTGANGNVLVIILVAIASLVAGTSVYFIKRNNTTNK